MKKGSFVLLLILIHQFAVYSQDTLNINYFNSLKNNLLKDSTVNNIRYFQKKYWNGNIKNQNFSVQYKSDSLHRYWRLGKSFVYYKNGQLYSIVNVDASTRALKDTTLYFDIKGNIAAMRIYSRNSKSYIPFKLVSGFFSIFHSDYVNYPTQYTDILMSNGKKVNEKPYTYYEDSGFMLNGDIIYYKEDGSLDKVVKYLKGQELK
jgi:hypothetical protein